MRQSAKSLFVPLWVLTAVQSASAQQTVVAQPVLPQAIVAHAIESTLPRVHDILNHDIDPPTQPDALLVLADLGGGATALRFAPATELRDEIWRRRTRRQGQSNQVQDAWQSAIHIKGERAKLDALLCVARAATRTGQTATSKAVLRRAVQIAFTTKLPLAMAYTGYMVAKSGDMVSAQRLFNAARSVPKGQLAAEERDSRILQNIDEARRESLAFYEAKSGLMAQALKDAEGMEWGLRRVIRGAPNVDALRDIMPSVPSLKIPQERFQMLSEICLRYVLLHKFDEARALLPTAKEAAESSIALRASFPIGKRGNPLFDNPEQSQLLALYATTGETEQAQQFIATLPASEQADFRASYFLWVVDSRFPSPTGETSRIQVLPAAIEAVEGTTNSELRFSLLRALGEALRRRGERTLEIRVQLAFLKEGERQLDANHRVEDKIFDILAAAARLRTLRQTKLAQESVQNYWRRLKSSAPLSERAMWFAVAGFPAYALAESAKHPYYYSDYEEIAEGQARSDPYGPMRWVLRLSNPRNRLAALVGWGKALQEHTLESVPQEENELVLSNNGTSSRWDMYGSGSSESG